MAPAFLLTLLLGAACPPEGERLILEASRLAGRLDRAAALAALERASPRECGIARVQAIYLRGLQAARDAYAVGGSPESLVPVERAAADLERLATTEPSAELARVILMAAAAAAQSERDDMANFLAHAETLTKRYELMGLDVTLVVSPYEAAGDLWLQVHRFEGARTAYDLALQQSGPTPALLAGRGRVAARLGDRAAACDAYGLLLRSWTGGPEPPAIAGAREYVAREGC